MDAEFRYLSGGFRGQVRIVRKEFATAGRHPSADLPFDIGRDLDVSVRHAAVFRQAGAWRVRDLGSSNGTWINGVRITADRTLVPGDVLRFGPEGPELRFEPWPGPAGEIPPTTPSHEPPTMRRAVAPVAGPSAAFRAEVARQSAGWKRVALAALLVAGAAFGGVVALAWRERRATASERRTLLARTDTLLATLASARENAAQLSEELDRARADIAALRERIADPAAGGDALDTLGTALAQRGRAGEITARAARFDRAAIDSLNADAITVVVSELPDGRRMSGSGFVFRARGDTGWVLTARHLVADSAGRVAWRLGVLFHGTAQNFRAEPVAVDDATEAAILRVRVRGGVPVVRGLGRDPPPGVPVAILGFPQGLDAAGEWRRTGVRAVGFTGTIRTVEPARIEIDGYGVRGSSGSPMFGADGLVAGMVYGGDPGSGGRIVYAVPVSVLQRVLDATMQ